MSAGSNAKQRVRRQIAWTIRNLNRLVEQGVPASIGPRIHDLVISLTLDEIPRSEDLAWLMVFLLRDRAELQRENQDLKSRIAKLQKTPPASEWVKRHIPPPPARIPSFVTPIPPDVAELLDLEGQTARTVVDDDGTQWMVHP